MDLINYQVVDNGQVIAELPHLAVESTVQVWTVPVEYQANGYFVSWDNTIPASDHGAPIFVGTLAADPELVAAQQEQVVIKSMVDAVQAHLDSIAQLRGYGDENTSPTISIVSYTDDVNPVFAADAATFKAYRSACWTLCYQILADVKNGLRTAPTVEELLAELPVIVW